MHMNPKIGEIYWIRFDGDGSAQRGLRPGVIFSNKGQQLWVNDYCPAGHVKSQEQIPADKCAD